MNILKVLGVVVGIHVVAYLVIAQPGCRSTAAKPAPAVTAAQPAPALTDNVTPVTPVADESAPALNLAFGAGDRFAPTRPGAEPPPAAATPAKAYTVQKGDSFYTIAHKNGITVDELTAANNLAKNASIRPGQKLVIPSKGAKASAEAAPAGAKGSAAPAAGGATYTVKSGDTLSKIAARYHTTSAALRTANGIAGDHLKIGQTLQIPGSGAPAASAGASLPPPPAASPVATPSVNATPAGAGVHTVGAGESAESIARKYQISVGELVRANQITDPRKIRIGQVLTIPGSGAAKAAKPAPSLVPDRVPAAAPTPAPAATPVFGPRVTAPAAETEAAPVTPVDAPVVPVDEAPPAVPVPQID